MYAAGVARGELRVDPAQSETIEKLDRLRAELAQPSQRGFFRRERKALKGLYIWGGVGCGKSMLMDMFVAALNDRPVRRVHFHAFMQEVHAGLHRARAEGVTDALAPVAANVANGLQVLALDEMQITDITDAMIVGRFFESLFAAGVLVVTTSNREPGDLYRDGLNRQLFLPFIELIKARMDVCKIASENDYRRDRLAGEQVYFTPITGGTQAAIQSIWDDLARGPGERLELAVKGRTVVLPAFRNGVARATFYDLCGQPLGPADYLAIAKTVRVLVLEDVPCLSRSNFNEAKRFVILVDALYEARVGLVVSAAARPEMLYLEGAGSFEFERTVSRLIEMQGAHWGQ